MNWSFLKSGTPESTLRVCVFLITVGILLNLVILPLLVYLALVSKQTVSWASGYLYSLSAIAGVALAGKVMQRKFEIDPPDKPEGDPPDKKDFGGKVPEETELHM